MNKNYRKKWNEIKNARSGEEVTQTREILQRIQRNYEFNKHILSTHYHNKWTLLYSCHKNDDIKFIYVFHGAAFYASK